MDKLIYSAAAMALTILVITLISAPNIDLYYKNSSDQYVPAVLTREGALNERSISLWTERTLANLLSMSPTNTDSTQPAEQQIRRYFSTKSSANHFFFQLNKIEFFEHLISQKQHTIFAPTTNTVIVNEISNYQWIVQTKGLLTFRSTQGEKTITVIFQMNIEIDKRSGKKRFYAGAIKRIASRNTISKGRLV